MVSIDPELIEQAKQWELNVSALTERAIREQLNINADELTKLDEYCGFCNRREIKAHIDRTDCRERLVDGMTWLYPDEMWICKSCLESKKRNVFKFA